MRWSCAFSEEFFEEWCSAGVQSKLEKHKIQYYVFCMNMWKMLFKRTVRLHTKMITAGPFGGERKRDWKEMGGDRTRMVQKDSLALPVMVYCFF